MPPRRKKVLGGIELGRGGQGIVETMDDFATAIRFASGGTKDVENVILVAVDLDTGNILRPIVKTSELSRWHDAVVFKRRLPGPYVVNDDDITQEFENTLMMGQAISKGLKEGKLHKEDVIVIHEASTLLVLELPHQKNTQQTHTVLVVGAQGKTEIEIYPFYRRVSGDLLHLENAIKGITGHHIMQAAKATLRLLATLRKIEIHHGDIKEENIMWISKGQSIEFAVGDFGMAPYVSARQSLHPPGTAGYHCPLLFPNTEEGRMKYTSYYPYPVTTTAGDMWNSYIPSRSKSLPEHDVAEKNDLYGLGVTLARMIDSPVEIRMLATRLMTGNNKDAALWHASDALQECAKIRSEDLKRAHLYIPDSAASHDDDIRFTGADSQRKRLAKLFA